MVQPPAPPPGVPPAPPPAAPPGMPPLPPPSVPPSVPPPYYAAPPAQPPRKSGSPLWLILGCGCLVALLLIGGGIWGGTHYWKTKVAPQLDQLKTQTTLPGAGDTNSSGDATTTTTTTTTETTPQDTTPAVNERPGKETALNTALGGKTGWVGKINFASGDWQRVKVWIGPAGSEFSHAVVLQWDTQANLYRVESTSAIPRYEPPVVIQTKPQVIIQQPKIIRRNPATPTGGTIYRPPKTTTTTTTSSNATSTNTSGPKASRTRAIQKALRTAPEGGWVAKISENNGDFTECAVMIGPPASEFVMEIRMRWDPVRHQYKILSKNPL